MLSPCRTPKSLFRPLLAAAKETYRISLVQTRPGLDTSYPSCSTSTSHSRLSNSSKEYHTTIRRADQGRDREFQQSSPAANTPVTPKAAKTVDEAQAWLREAFSETPFPDDIAMMMITHESWDHGKNSGHNRRLSFLGRRAMKFYISLFLSKNSRNGEMLSSAKVNELLHTSKLGDHVGRHLRLAEIMRWTPAISNGQTGPKETGLYKIRGVTVEALIGAIYHQHGARAARAFFSSQILPNLGTFSAREVEQLQGAIESEAKTGLAILKDCSREGSPLGETQEADQGTMINGTTREETQPFEQRSDVKLSRPTTPLNSTRRRTTTKTDLSLEEDSRSVRTASERRQSIV